MFCDGCGSELQPAQVFCSRCGKQIVGPVSCGSAAIRVAWRVMFTCSAFYGWRYSAFNTLGGLFC